MVAEMNRADSWYFPYPRSKDPVEANHPFGLSHRRGNVVEAADLASFLCPGAHCQH